mmetsp:Transcript_26340/g.62675  ORF Transcript_26340/g.62675 Transcript_26340/m.62675 type:complete len:104 (-) Transcript_26340:380-691(-)
MRNVTPDSFSGMKRLLNSVETLQAVGNSRSPGICTVSIYNLTPQIYSKFSFVPALTFFFVFFFFCFCVGWTADSDHDGPSGFKVKPFSYYDSQEKEKKTKKKE